VAKSRIFRVTAALLFVLSVSVFLTSAASSHPRIEFEELVYDWGNLWEGESASHAFRFKNTGNEPLRIHKVSSP
jgi:hypothetical protein